MSIESIEGINYTTTEVSNETDTFENLSKLKLKLKTNIKLTEEQVHDLLYTGNKAPEGIGEVYIENTNLPEHLNEKQVKFFSQ